MSNYPTYSNPFQQAHSKPWRKAGALLLGLSAGLFLLAGMFLLLLYFFHLPADQLTPDLQQQLAKFEQLANQQNMTGAAMVKVYAIGMALPAVVALFLGLLVRAGSRWAMICAMVVVSLLMGVSLLQFLTAGIWANILAVLMVAGVCCLLIVQMKWLAVAIKASRLVAPAPAAINVPIQHVTPLPAWRSPYYNHTPPPPPLNSSDQINLDSPTDESSPASSTVSPAPASPQL